MAKIKYIKVSNIENPCSLAVDYKNCENANATINLEQQAASVSSTEINTLTSKLVNIFTS